jgi:hypothetical protein
LANLTSSTTRTTGIGYQGSGLFENVDESVIQGSVAKSHPLPALFSGPLPALPFYHKNIGNNSHVFIPPVRATANECRINSYSFKQFSAAV